MNFTKVEATGNDFILIDGRIEKKDWPVLAREMCDRHFGIGADGLLIILPSKVANIRMQIFNSDGSEPEMCGNGLRCFVRYAAEHLFAESKPGELTIETKAGIRTARIQMKDNQVSSVSLKMGRPQLAAEKIPVALPKEAIQTSSANLLISYDVNVGGKILKLRFVSMGNPHAICFIDEPVDLFPLDQIGPLVEKHQIFPQRTNFEIVNVLSRNKVKARVWERGCGETLSCGTGACAINVASQLSGLTDSKIDVTLPGGTLNIEWDRINEVQLSGPAREVYQGSWPESA